MSCRNLGLWIIFDTSSSLSVDRVTGGSTGHVCGAELEWLDARPDSVSSEVDLEGGLPSNVFRGSSAEPGECPTAPSHRRGES